ncbi:MAG: phytoene/squalene synthase family protein [Roseiflexaceae bacterium]|nr:phytoene/squalene synthase family protein [Roseiflexaceae bacterium]
MSLHHSSRWAVPVHGVRQVPPGEASALLDALRRTTEHEPLFPHDTAHGAIDIHEAYRHCWQVTRTHSRSFFLSSQFLPAEKRQAIRALYALCRTTDDIVDQSAGDVERSLSRWVSLVQAAAPPPCDPVLVAWADTAGRYDVPQTLVNELLAGVAMDLTVSRYATFDDLWLYCYRVASVVGLLSMHIVGYRQGAQPYAVSLGIALQLTNILRDVGEDAARGRIYLPQEDLARFGLCDDDILAGRRDERFRALMRYEIERAHTLYEESWPGMQLLSEDSRFAIGAAAQVYRGILGKIVVNDFDVFNRRAHLSLREKVWLLPDVRRRLRALEH